MPNVEFEVTAIVINVDLKAADFSISVSPYIGAGADGSNVELLSEVFDKIVAAYAKGTSFRLCVDETPKRILPMTECNDCPPTN